MKSSPSVAASVLLGIVAVPTLLFANWVLAPHVIGLFASIERAGPFFFATSAAQLIADLALCFSFAVALMFIAQLRRAPHGTAVAACMAFFGWAIYFMEVGYFSGMLHSEYPWWYEALSFIKYPLAFALSFYLTRRAQPTVQRDGPTSGGSAR